MMSIKWHETQRFNQNDKYFIIGMNPDGNGGGIIGTATNEAEARIMRNGALAQNYTQVRVRTWKELNEVS